MPSVHPSFHPEQLRAMDNAALLALLSAHDDRLPRSVIDECTRRGEILVPALRAILEDDANWSEAADIGQWWSLLHAIMILGAIPGAASAEALMTGFRRMKHETANPLWDWLAGYWPALFRNKRTHAQPALEAIAVDKRCDWYPRIQALECLIEGAHAQGENALESCLDWIRGLMEEAGDDHHFCGLAGSILLDFPRERHRQFLEKVGHRLRRHFKTGPPFDRDDVAAAFARSTDQPDWEQFSDPWQFYDDAAIHDRQARWAREAAEEEAQAAAELAELQARQPIQREAPKIGRNEPCPCGSGKKYKRCCLDKADKKPADLTWRRLRRVIDGLPQQMLRFADATLGPGAIEQAWAEFSSEPDHAFTPDNILIPVFMPWFFYHWRPRPPINGHTTIAEGFLVGKPGQRLDPLARRYIEAAIGAPFSFYDVKASRPGQGMTLRDILTGETIEVTEHSASQTMRPADILLAQPVRLDNLIVLESCGPIAIPPHAKQPIVQWRKELRAQYGVISRDILRDLVPEVLDLYQDLAAQLTDSRLPQLHNTDGEPLRPQELIFDIDAPQAAFDALYSLSLKADPQSLLANAEYDDKGRLHKVRFPWLKQGNARHKSWQNTILGDIAIEGNRLTLHVNSDERAARIKKEVERRLGSQAHYRSTVLHSVEKMLEENKTSTQEPEPLPPELQEKLVEIMEAHWDQWIHEKIPALGDMTPLEAAKDPDGRELLEALLNDIQRKPALHPQLPDYDPVPKLRARLGLEQVTPGS